MVGLARNVEAGGAAVLAKQPGYETSAGKERRWVMRKNVALCLAIERSRGRAWKRHQLGTGYGPQAAIPTAGRPPAALKETLSCHKADL
jgi:hypothetical protein